MSDTAPRRVRVAPGRTLHRGASGLPFQGGDLIDLPPAHAEQLARAGHVVLDADAAAPPAASSAESVGLKAK